MRYLITVLLLFISTSTIYGQLTAVNLGNWKHEGLPANGTWTISTDSSSVRQSRNDEPTFFVSPDTFENVTIRGDFFVDGSDDDYIGFVFGYLRPDSAEEYFDFYLLDWKGVTQSGAQEGFTLSKVLGYVNVGSGTNTSHPYWDHEDTTQTVLGTYYGDYGWIRNVVYNFELIYEPNRVRITIDTTLIFDISGEFRPGRFGFYNYSQPGVNYQKLTLNEAPVAVADYFDIREDSTLTMHLTLNDSDADGHDIIITRVEESVNGVINYTPGDSLIYYTPNANFFGTDSLNYHISDGNGGFDSAKVVIIISPVNDAPVRVVSIPDTVLNKDSQNIFYRKLNNIFADPDANDAPLDSFYVNTLGIVSADLNGDSLYLSANNIVGVDTIIVTAVDDSNAVFSETFIVEVLDVTALEDLTTPEKFSLHQNYPNPFNPSTVISWQLAIGSHVELSVYSLLGERVTTLVSERMNQGNHTYQFDGKNLASGIYYYQIIAGEHREVKKMILLR